MNLELFGKPVHLYPEKDSYGQEQQSSLEVAVASVTQPENAEESGFTEPSAGDDTGRATDVSDTLCSAQKLENHTKEPVDALSQLLDQVPKSCQVDPQQAQLTLEDYVLCTRDFNSAMGLPVGSVARCVTKERGQICGRMLREEILEVEQAIESGVVHEVLAESVDVFYLMFNLIQERGLEQTLGPAVLIEHGDNMRKQHETIPHLSWTRSAYAKSCNATENAVHGITNWRRQMVALLEGQAHQASRLCAERLLILIMSGQEAEVTGRAERPSLIILLGKPHRSTLLPTLVCRLRL